MIVHVMHLIFFFFNDTATTEIYTLSLHDALPISISHGTMTVESCAVLAVNPGITHTIGAGKTLKSMSNNAIEWNGRSEEHTSELQSRLQLVCRLLLEKKKKN